jgi:hypothetical protein
MLLEDVRYIDEMAGGSRIGKKKGVPCGIYPIITFSRSAFNSDILPGKQNYPE